MVKTTIAIATFFTLAVPTVFAAPDIRAPFLLVPPNIFPGQSVTFTGDVWNAGDAMDTTNSYQFIEIGEGYPPTSQLWYLKLGILGSYAYTRDQFDKDVEIYNIMNPTAPAYISKLQLGSCSVSSMLVLSGNYLYVDTGGCAVGSYGFSIYNVGPNPTAPVFVGKGMFSRSTSASALAISGNYAYVGEEDTGFIDAFDISNLASPVKSGEVSLGASATIATRAIVVSGRYAYVTFTHTDIAATVPEFAVLDLINPTTPQLVATLDLTPSTGSGAEDAGGLTLAISGNYAYVGMTAGRGGPYVVNISDPINPTKGAWSGELPNGTWSVKVSGNYLYAVDKYNGFFTYDISNPISPVRKADGPGPSPVDINNNRYSDIIIGNFYAYVDRWANSVAIGGARVEIYEPHTFARFCIDNVSCLTSTTGRLGDKDYDAELLGANASYATSTTWTATLGDHTIYFCADVRDTNGYDGVAESNEANNCTSATFTVGSPPLPDLSSQNTGPASGSTFIPTDSITFTGNAVNSMAASITQGGWADLEIDVNSDGAGAQGTFDYNVNAFGGVMLGAFVPGQTKALSAAYGPPLPIGTHRYRFNVDVTNVLAESDEVNRSAWITFTVAAPSATLSANPTTCTIAIGASTCTVPFTWNIQNAATPNLYNNTRALQYTTNPSDANVSYPITNGANTVQARDGSTVLASVVVTGSCAAGSTWNGAFCLANASVDSFSLTSSSIPYNTSTMLNWTTTGATSVTIDQSIGGVAVDGSISTGNRTVTTTFTVTASNGVGPNATAQVTLTVLTGCAYNIDVNGNTIVNLDAYDRTSAEQNGKYQVTKWPPTRCFGNTGSSRYLIPLGSQFEFDSFWNNIEAGSNLPGPYRIP